MINIKTTKNFVMMNVSSRYVSLFFLVIRVLSIIDLILIQFLVFIRNVTKMMMKS